MPRPTEFLTDYHMHSTFSPDGDNSPAELCQQALDIGLKAIAITEHAEWHPSWKNAGFPQADAYFAAIEQCRAQFEPQGLTIFSGIELGNPHQYAAQARAFLAAYPFEVVLASLHWLYGTNIHWEACFADRYPDDVYADYFIEVERMAAQFDFDAVAHIDRIIWRGVLRGTPPNLHRLEPFVRDALSTIARRGQALELNTKYLNHDPNWNEILITILRWFRIAGGMRVVVNSDAHRTHEIGRNQTIAMEILARTGFDASMQFLPFSHNNLSNIQNHYVRD